MDRIVEPGAFGICAGPSSADIQCAELQVTGPVHVLQPTASSPDG